MIRKWTVDKLAAPEGIHRFHRLGSAVVFQPIVDLATGRAFAHEALVRCKLPEFSSPPVLFEHAVRDGFCGRLGRLIRDVTFETCGDVALFVNLHPDELTSHWLVQPTNRSGFYSRPVFLKITETAILTHYELCLQALRRFCGRTGAQLVVDDFGAGYSRPRPPGDALPRSRELHLATNSRASPEQAGAGHRAPHGEELVRGSRAPASWPREGVIEGGRSAPGTWACSMPRATCSLARRPRLRTIIGRSQAHCGEARHTAACGCPAALAPSAHTARDAKPASSARGKRNGRCGSRRRRRSRARARPPREGSGRRPRHGLAQSRRREVGEGH